MKYYISIATSTALFLLFVHSKIDGLQNIAIFYCWLTLFVNSISNVKSIREKLECPVGALRVSEGFRFACSLLCISTLVFYGFWVTSIVLSLGLSFGFISRELFREKGVKA